MIVIFFKYFYYFAFFIVTMLSPLLQLLVTLRFYATGMLTTVGDFGGIAKTTSCTITKPLAISRNLADLPEGENEIVEDINIDIENQNGNDFVRQQFINEYFQNL